MDIIKKQVKIENKSPLNVVITGAAGQIAYTLYGLLGNGNIFGEDQPLNLKLLDLEQAAGLLNGLVLELQDCAFPLVLSIQAGFNAEQLFLDADICIFLGGFPRKPGMERRDLMSINNKIFREQGVILDKYARKTCKSLVIANPANTNCLTLIKSAPSIPKKNFTCLSRLDHNRAIGQLALKANVTGDKIKNLIIWGNHSLTQYPDVNHATINGVPLTDVICDSNYLQNDFIRKIQKRGAEVLEIRKNSSVMSVSNAIKDHLKSWYFGTTKDDFVSFGVYMDSDNPYEIANDIVCSVPVRCKDFDWEIVQGLEINQFSKDKIKQSVNELLDEREESQCSNQQ